MNLARVSESNALQSFGLLLFALRLCASALLRLKERKILAVSLFFQFGNGNKTQRRGVHTKTFAGRLRTIVKDVAEMRVAGF